MTSNRRHFRNLLVAVAIATPLALTGCGGGSGSSMMTEDDSDMMAADDSDMMPMDEVEPLTIPDGLASSSAAPVIAMSADDTLAELLPNPANVFAPLLAMLGPDATGQNTLLESTFNVKTVSSDGNDGYRVTYEVGGEEVMIHFQESDFLEDGGYFEKDIDGGTLFFGSYAGSTEFDFLDIAYVGSWDEATRVTDRAYMSFGARTDGASLPSGSATYVGRIYADSYLRDDPSTANRDRVQGALRLQADFGESTIDGVIVGIAVRRPSEAWSVLPESTYFQILDGRIVDGQFTADMTGVDSNENAQADETVAGYAGALLGEFYGPAAEEVGGVLNASSDDRVMAGVFGGRQWDPNVPSGVHASPGTPVYATATSDVDDLWDAGTRFAPVSAALRREATGYSLQAEEDTYVKRLNSDGNGGAVITYVVGGVEDQVLFTLDDFLDSGGYYDQGTNQSGHQIWFGGFSYEYLRTVGFVSWEPNGELTWFSGTFGTRTEAANLPTGTATYTGFMGANSRNQRFTSTNRRNRLSGDVTLTARFDESTIDGTIDNLHIRRYGEDDYSPMSGTTHFAIENGVIDDGQFTASLSGVDSDAAAPLADSVRGFEGGVIGEFYGPAAEEVGGHLNASRDEDLRVMWGNFQGRKQ